MSAQRVRVDIGADRIARVTLVHGEKGNAIDPAMVASLDDAVATVEASLSAGPEVGPRAVLISAEGRAFTVGGDLRHFLDRQDALGEELAAMIAPFHDTLFRLAALPTPVVCAIGGPAAGGGLGLAYCSDVVLASPQARFACGFHRLGLSGDGASTWFLPRLVGLRRAQEMILRGRVLEAGEALDWGLVTEVVAAEELLPRAEIVAAEFAAAPPVAIAHMRRLLRESFETSLQDHYARELQAMIATGGTADAAEGVRAFAERRDPEFRGA